ncbi:DEAD/DEAH box helicase [Coleofasciculus sp.]|uniref:DEAD/DEAH box helicase n=1 Tax=Coleofasciculus sp. TaxID=3100458 RepID=UPI0039FB6377
MAKFRTSKNQNSVPESIDLMFRDLKRDPSIKFLGNHQGQILNKYEKDYLKNAKDIAIELPTGTGKTLIGLLIAEYRRRIRKERVVYLCPTRQLCSQVHKKANLYGINTVVLMGQQKDYDPTDFYNYQRAEVVAITTYSGIFNTNPKISDPETIICDDAHAADNYVASLWTVSINRKDHKQLFDQVVRILESVIPEYVGFYLKNGGSYFENKQVDLISNIACHNKHQQIIESLESLIKFNENDQNYRDLKYAWGFISSHLDACSIYCSSENFEIRPIIPPTLTHQPFSNAHQRIYMSATLGEDGDLERVFGVNKIPKIPIPGEWNKRSIGRKLIFLPAMSSGINPKEVAATMLQKRKRGLILVPNNTSLQAWSNLLKDTHTILQSTDIEESLETFTKSNKPTVLILATRYDGIDLPGDDCRFIVLDGMPTGSGLQEKFLLTRLGASSQLRNRIRTRVTQAMGRCTRDENDYALVILLGEDLTKWCCTSINLQGMHPELQAEVQFGLDNSTELEVDNFVELGEDFFNKTPDWKDAENEIQKLRDSSLKVSDDVAEALAKSMPHEINYVYQSWNGKHKEAFNEATKVLDSLEGGTQLKPYVTFWYHQAANSAFLAWKESDKEIFRNSAISSLEKALKTTKENNWLNKLFPYLEKTADENDNLPWREWFMQINDLLTEWGIMGSKYSQKVATVQTNIVNIDATPFEDGLESLGRMLGAKTHKWKKKEQGKPDGLWIFGNWHAFVFEAKTEEGRTEETANYGISLNTVTQAGRHETTVRAEGHIPDYVPCSTVLISPRQKLNESAIIHTQEISYCSHDEMVKLFDRTASVLELVRSFAPNNTEEDMMEYAIEVYSKRNLGMQDIKNLLLKQKLDSLPKTKS